MQTAHSTQHTAQHSTQALTGNPMESFQGTLGLSRIRTPSLGWVGCICPDGWSDKCWRKVLVGVFTCTYGDYMDKPFHSQRCVLFVQSSPNSHLSVEHGHVYPYGYSYGSVNFQEWQRWKILPLFDLLVHLSDIGRPLCLSLQQTTWDWIRW